MHSFAVTADGTTLASVGFENERPNEIFLWDLEKREVKSRFQGADFWPGYVVFSPDEKTLAVAGTRLKLPSDISGVVTLWDVATGKQEKESKRIPLSVDAVAYAPDGKLLAIATALDEVELWNAETLEPVTKLTGHTNSVSHVAFSADGKLIASASRDKTVRLWNVPPKGAAATKGATGKTKGTKPTKPSKKK
ncbi:MAG: hypothetical protein NT069_03485 [Planctomycetota bacterium]|nr:hypothetical protein [Planctomycetota bacterium]